MEAFNTVAYLLVATAQRKLLGNRLDSLILKYFKLCIKIF